ncbi:hypothetical protein ILYODFUR_005616 [Ilyodon furcidens]|uniref:Uncharacterized protein n=1 Tax=Ilyodon furcidens TaxID=33524 RepID=A0ABV0TTY5_9TELE
MTRGQPDPPQSYPLVQSPVLTWPVLMTLISRVTLVSKRQLTQHSASSQKNSYTKMTVIDHFYHLGTVGEAGSNIPFKQILLVAIHAESMKEVMVYLLAFGFNNW